MQLLLGQLVGQNRDLMDEVARRRSYEVETPAMTGPQKRLEDMMRQILRKLGGAQEYDEYLPESAGSTPPPSPPPTMYTKDGSMYRGNGSVYSDDGKVRAPAPSFTSSYDRKKRFSGVPDSLLNGSVGGGEFDHYTMDDLPPDDPPREHVIPHVQVPPHLARQRRQQQSEAPTPMIIPAAIPEEPEYYEESIPEGQIQARPNQQAYAETEPESPTPPPVPYKQNDTPSEYSDDYNRGQINRGPPPQAVDLPTPVNSLRNLPTNGQGYMPGMPMGMQGGRPPYPGMMPPMPRPSLPRIAGVRDPISTT